MAEIFQDPQHGIRLKFPHAEVRAHGIIDFPDSTGLAINDDGEMGKTCQRVYAHLRDIIVLTDEGATAMGDGIYEVTSSGMMHVADLVNVDRLMNPLADLIEPVNAPADASALEFQ